MSSLQRQNDPDGLRNFRSPVFDLDSVYGQGRATQPYLFQQEAVGGSPVPGTGPKLLLGAGEGDGEDDLPRNDQQVALIGDPRNDEHVIVGQLQLAFLKLHNRIVDDIRAGELDDHLWGTGDDVSVFHEAQRLTRWHYQWVVLRDFLPRICGQDVVSEYVDVEERDGRTCRRIRDLRYYRPKVAPYIPVEWSVAAYRYGHSQIRPTYNLNGTVRDVEIFIESPDDANRLQHLGGGRRLPAQWTIDWRFFFEQEGADGHVQASRLIDTKLAEGLQHLPTPAPRVLAERNLLRGRSMGLPSGQAVARRMCEQPLTADELGVDGEAPLWFYVLREAQVRAEGRTLGPVGARIVAEVFLGILAADAFCFLRTEPGWEPVLPASVADDQQDWGMADLLAYAVPEDGRRFTP